ncbi:hypothetical protein FRACYDRAFT_246160 [Fragilariopsis cylindrus CCMP1102]|uniref:Uncharacterized protein n=1 Tax=Fragilariopsis cylindrus CCMP1102 TaxID=635003 RepID=A0A1E7EZ02_9STRA|nr:hypothetical protein FRACYDRAFT_246160 [Fragilariopsis cylindrus CCMP1102]|eukprot:OEU11056.1 hypothetical protein FRACYDRAFT_246160 [Fragilariopsis cylindrus CCMP1102]
MPSSSSASAPSFWAATAAMTASISVVVDTVTNNNNKDNKIKGKEENEEEDLEEMTQMMFDLWGSKEKATFNNTMADTIAAYVKLTSGSNASVWNTSDENKSNTLAIEVNKVWAKNYMI